MGVLEWIGYIQPWKSHHQKQHGTAVIYVRSANLKQEQHFQHGQVNAPSIRQLLHGVPIWESCCPLEVGDPEQKQDSLKCGR